MHLGFLMDPLEQARVDHDSTLALMFEAQRRGHAVHCFEQRDLVFGQGEARARMRTVTLRREQAPHFQVLETAERAISALDVVFLRKDPPVDVEFLHATQLVELTGPRRPLFVNEPAGIRDCNEKLFALSFPDLVPKTAILRDLARLRAFVSDAPGGAVVKPIDGFGGQGVLFCEARDRNLQALLELATEGGRRAVIAQHYLPASREGDKRILLVDGEPRGAVLRVPREDDHRANLAAGGTAAKAVLTPRDLHICARLAPELRARGLHFVGIDVIGECLIEINVTSPTGVVEADRLDGVYVERDVFDFIERSLSERGAATDP